MFEVLINYYKLDIFDRLLFWKSVIIYYSSSRKNSLDLV